jgi:hemolysin activation/secretion protein
MRTFMQLRQAFVVIAFACGAGIAVAQNAVPVVQDPADRLLREQQEQDRLQRLQQETPAVTLPQQSAIDPNAAPQSVQESGATFAIERIVLKGEALLADAELNAITKPFAGMQLGVNRINLLLHKLTQTYVERGFVTTRVYVGEQNLSSGTLELTVVPGKVEKVSMNGKPLALGEDLAMPVQEGAVLKLQDLEQGMDQLNRLRRNQAQAQIQPGATPGGSVIAITNTPGDRLYYNIGFDNGGDKATGELRLRTGVEANNLFGLQESLNLTYSGSLDTNALVLGTSLPFGYNTLSYAYSYSEFQNLIGDVALVFGRSRGHTLSWNRLLARSRYGKSALDVSVSAREAAREINNVLLTPQKLAVLRLGYNQLRRFQLGKKAGFWTVDLSYSRGLDALDATDDDDVADLTSEAAHAQFDKVNVAASVSLALNPRWTYRGGFDAQWANEGLFGSEQFFAGGVASVRGFAESAAAGERGLGTRHELSYSGWPALLGERVRFAPFVFLDAARVQLVAEDGWKDLAGTGVGVRASGKRFSAELIVGQPLEAPELVEKDTRVHASVNFNF